MLNVQRILKNVSDDIFYKCLTLARLSTIEYKILQEFILRGRHRDIICHELNISRSYFNITKNLALTKIKLSLSEAIDEKLKMIA